MRNYTQSSRRAFFIEERPHSRWNDLTWLLMGSAFMWGFAHLLWWCFR